MMRSSRHTFHALIIACSAIFALVAMVTASHADDGNKTTMIVLDGSGSMWAKVPSGEAQKIEIIRGKLADLVAAARQTRVGLAAFGHRRRRDCGDSELIANPATDKTAVTEAIQSFNPRGKGPLVEAFRLAADAINKARSDGGGPASILIINDGADNCKQDACAAASAFAADVPGVPIHLLAIGVGPIHKSRLECMASATGGSYVEAHTEEEILSALDDVAGLAGLTPEAVSAAVAKPKTEAPKPEQDGASLKAYLVLKDGGAPLSVPARWTVRDNESKTVLAESEGPTITAKMDPGSFSIEAEMDDFRVSAKQTLDKGDATSLALPLDAARLRATTRRKAGGVASQSALISVEPALGAGRPATGRFGAARISHGGELDALLMPGAYVVTTVEGPIRASKQIELEAGDDERVAFVLDSGRLQLAAREREAGAPLEDVTFVITTDDPDQPDGRREVARSRAPTPVFPLPAGTYYIEARTGLNTVTRRVAVSAGETTSETIVIPLVPVTLNAVIGNKPAKAGQGVSYRVSSLDDGGREIGRFLLPTVSIQLIPGRYRVEARLASDHISAETAFTLKTGDKQDLTIEIPVARLKLALADGPTLVSDTFWEITGADGAPVWRNTDPTPTALVSPGRYTVSFESRTRRLKADIEVASGDERTVILGETTSE